MKKVTSIVITAPGLFISTRSGQVAEDTLRSFIEYALADTKGKPEGYTATVKLSVDADRVGGFMIHVVDDMVGLQCGYENDGVDDITDDIMEAVWALRSALEFNVTVMGNGQYFTESESYYIAELTVPEQYGRAGGRTHDILTVWHDNIEEPMLVGQFSGVSAMSPWEIDARVARIINEYEAEWMED